jgi:hypothetical protein
LNKKYLFYRKIENLVKLNPPSFVIALGYDQQQFLKKSYQWESDFFIIPCGIRNLPIESFIKPEWANTEKIIFGYCGNVGEAHNEQFILDIILSLNPDEHVFIASLYGSKGQKLAKIINDYPHVIQKSNVTPEELSFIDVHLVSLLNKWIHVCVPSKAVSAVCMGATFLFNGATNGDTWRYLSNAGWRIDQNYQINELKQLIESIKKSSLSDKRKEARQTSIELNEMKISEFNRLLKYFNSTGFS